MSRFGRAAAAAVLAGIVVFIVGVLGFGVVLYFVGGTGWPL